MEIAEQLDRLRIQTRNRERQQPEYKYQILLAKYEMHCRAYKLNPKDTNSFKNFLQADYGKEYNLRSIKKYFANRYFNYNFSIDKK